MAAAASQRPAARASELVGRDDEFSTPMFQQHRDLRLDVGTGCIAAPYGRSGWFYDRFVKDHLFDAKLAKYKEGLLQTGGKVGTWFDDEFQYTAWPEIHRQLTAEGLPSMDVQEANRLVKAGKATLLDVREERDFNDVYAEGSYSAPLFRQIQGNDTKAFLRRVGYALLTNFAGTERNPDFIAQALQAVGGNKQKQVLVMCGRGGTLETIVRKEGLKKKEFKDPERMFGIQSRSLKAIWELRQAGFKNIVHVTGGLNQWMHKKLPSCYP
eukprot:SM000136S00158  [mRNA]  locus=s136:61659:63738:- [translate_table: standard]